MKYFASLHVLTLLLHTSVGHISPRKGGWQLSPQRQEDLMLHRLSLKNEVGLIPESVVIASQLLVQNASHALPGEPINPDDLRRSYTVDDSFQLNDDDIPQNKDLYQGDIVVDKMKLLSMLNNQAVNDPAGLDSTFLDDTVWPFAAIPYQIDAKFSPLERAVIAKAMQAFHDHTCIRLVPRDRDQDFIFITKKYGCSSHVGRQGGRQEVTLGPGCIYKGVVIHELMHAAGFWHEHSRPDRDKHVNIMWNNILSDMRYNFKKFGWNMIKELQVGYDTGSIMHYGSNSFAVDKNKPTIVAYDNSVIGQRVSLSSKDKTKLNKLYNCGSIGGGTFGTTRPPPTTAASIVTTTKPKACIDTDVNCSYWAKHGECESNASWMKKNCRISCDQCKLKGKESPCSDDNTRCKEWGTMGYCVNFVTYMKKHCTKACGMCIKVNPINNGIVPNKCVSSNEYCDQWAKLGECIKNPSYMLDNCKRACGQC